MLANLNFPLVFGILPEGGHLGLKHIRVLILFSQQKEIKLNVLGW